MTTNVYRTASVLVGLAAMGVAPAALASPGATIPVEARITADGAPLDGGLTLEVRLYTEPRAGTPVFAESQQVRADRGRLAFSVGSAVPLDLVELTDAGELWMGLAIDGQDEMRPRIRFGTVPFAARAGVAADAARFGGKAPEAYAPAAHRHALRDVSGIPDSWLDGDDVRPDHEVIGLARRACFDTPEELAEVLDDRYRSIDADPYGALYREGRLDGQDRDDLLTVGLASSTFLQAHVPLAGDVVTTGEFRWSTPRARTVMLPGAAFVVDSEPEDRVQPRRRESTLGFSRSGLGGELNVFGTLELPVGAMLDRLSCAAADEDPSSAVAFDLRFGVRGLSDFRGTELAQVTLATETDPGALQRAQVGLQTTVQPDHEYYISGSIRSDAPSAEVRFLGCAVTMRQVGPE